jgi:hypothetical protein
MCKDFKAVIWVTAFIFSIAYGGIPTFYRIVYNLSPNKSMMRCFEMDRSEMLS